MDEWFNTIAAEYDLPEAAALQLRDAGYVVVDGPVATAECAQLAQAYDAAVLAAHPDDVSIRSSTRVHDFVNRGPEFDELYLYGPLLAACCRVIGRPRFYADALDGNVVIRRAPDRPIDVWRDCAGVAVRSARG
jgi:hypothetical protein